MFVHVSTTISVCVCVCVCLCQPDKTFLNLKQKLLLFTGVLSKACDKQNFGGPIFVCVFCEYSLEKILSVG